MKLSGKCTVALLLAFCLSVGQFAALGAEETVPAEQSFPDVPVDAWYAEAVDAMKDSGIIMGCEDGLFHPEKLVTQGEFYTMILRAATYPGANVSGGRKGESDHWAAGVLSLAESGAGYHPNAVSYGENGDRVFAGHEDDPVSRAEAVTRITALYWDNSGMDNKWSNKTIQNNMPGEPMAFDDIPDCEATKNFLASEKWRSDCHTYLFDYLPDRVIWGEGVTNCIAYAYNQGICKGVDEAGTFDADGLLTRAEVAQLFSNAGITYRLNLLPGKRTGMSGLAYDLSSTENVVR